MTYKIIDNQGTIHSGSEEEMTLAYDIMTLSEEEIKEIYEFDDEEYEKQCNEFKIDWTGDLELLECKATFA